MASGGGLALLAVGCAGPINYAAGDVLLPHDSFEVSSDLFEVEGEIGEIRRIAVYVPEAYYANSDDCFPVLYMPDGGVLEDFPHISGTVDALIEEGAIPPMLVVGIENTLRRRDLTGSTTVAEDREIADVVGGSAAFRAFIRDELMPDIEARYRCTDETAIVGESLAGLFVMETFMVEPDLFDAYIAVSPSLWWNDRALVRDAVAGVGGHEGLGNALYLTSANEADISPHTESLAAILDEHAPADLRWTFAPRLDLEHHTVFRAVKDAAFRFAFAP